MAKEFVVCMVAVLLSFWIANTAYPSTDEKVKPQEMIDTRSLDEMERSGFFEQIWGGKR